MTNVLKHMLNTIKSLSGLAKCRPLTQDLMEGIRFRQLSPHVHLRPKHLINLVYRTLFPALSPMGCVGMATSIPRRRRDMGDTTNLPHRYVGDETVVCHCKTKAVAIWRQPRPSPPISHPPFTQVAEGFSAFVAGCSS